MKIQLDRSLFEPLPRCQAIDRVLRAQCANPAFEDKRICLKHGAAGGPPVGNTNALKTGLFSATYKKEQSILREALKDESHIAWDETTVDPKTAYMELVRTNTILIGDTLRQISMAKAQKNNARADELLAQYVLLGNSQNNALKELAKILAEGDAMGAAPSGIVMLPRKELNSRKENHSGLSA